MKVKTMDETKKVEEAADKAAYRNFGHAAASIRKEAAESIQPGALGRDAKGKFTTSSQPSRPGEPPHTRGKRLLKRAFRFASSKDGAVIGPIESMVGESASAHEHGGTYRGQQFPQRPFMYPALLQNTSRFAGSWRGSIGS